MQDGYDLIYHAYLIDGDFRGEADFLIKTKELKSKFWQFRDFGQTSNWNSVHHA